MQHPHPPLEEQATQQVQLEWVLFSVVLLCSPTTEGIIFQSEGLEGRSSGLMKGYFSI